MRKAHYWSIKVAQACICVWHSSGFPAWWLKQWNIKNEWKKRKQSKTKQWGIWRSSSEKRRCCLPLKKISINRKIQGYWNKWNTLKFVSSIQSSEYSDYFFKERATIRKVQVKLCFAIFNSHHWIKPEDSSCSLHAPDVVLRTQVSSCCSCSWKRRNAAVESVHVGPDIPDQHFC